MTGTVREYLYAGGKAPTAMRSRNSDGSYSDYFFVTNTHGDVVALTDKDGNVVNRYAYGPWGEATRVSEQVHQPFRYAGYFYEPTADLYWLRARWYDAATGRFLSRDPNRGTRADAASLNRYGYAAGAPPSAVDSAGLAPTKVIFVPGVDPHVQGTGTDSAFAEWLMNIDVATGGALSATYFAYESGPVYSNAKRCLSRIGGCSGVGADAALDLSRYLDSATSQFASIHVIAHSLGSWVALEGIRGSQRFVDTLILAGGSTPISSQSKPGNLGVLVNMCSDADRGWKQSRAIASCRADEHITAKIPGDHSAYVRTQEDRRHLANRELESFYLAIWTRLFGINFN